MVRVVEYKETIDYIKDSYNYQETKEGREFCDEELVTIKLIISGLTRDKAKQLHDLIHCLMVTKAYVGNQYVCTNQPTTERTYKPTYNGENMTEHEGES